MFDSCLVNLQLPMEQNPFPVSLCLCGLHIKYFLINHIHYIVMKSSVYFIFCLLAVSFLSTPLLSSREKEILKHKNDSVKKADQFFDYICL